MFPHRSSTAASRLSTFIGRGLVAAAALMLTGCVTVQSVLPPSESPKATSAYVAGIFDASGADDYGLGLTSVNGGAEVVLPFADLTKLRNIPATQEKMNIVELPPGRYRISSWLTFARFTKEQVARKELPKTDGFEFDVALGRVRYIGKFSGLTSHSMFKVHFKITPQRVSRENMALLLEMSYPNFPVDLIDPQPQSVY
jgi:hypothetical protein